MSFELIINKLSDIFLFPPASSFILLAIGFYLKSKSRRKAIVLWWLAFFNIYLLSLPVFANYLNSSLQTHQALSQKQVKNLSLQSAKTAKNQATQKTEREIIARAIVVLSAGRRKTAAEFGDIDTVSSKTLQRLQYAAWLHRKTGYPILVSGGSSQGDATAEGVLMNQTMLSSFNIAPKWIEAKSSNTFENARFSSKILLEQEITEIILVTHAIHMRRAVIAFEEKGLIIIAAPTVFRASSSQWSDYLPSANALNESQQALHEMVGRVWYAIRY